MNIGQNVKLKKFVAVWFAERHKLPTVPGFIMRDDINIAVIRFNLEIAPVGTVPPVKNLPDRERSRSQGKAGGPFVGPMARV